MAPLSRFVKKQGLSPSDLADLIQQGRKSAPQSDAVRRLLDEAEADPRRMDVDPEELVPASEETLVVDPETGSLVAADDGPLAPVPAEMQPEPQRRMTKEEIDAEIAAIDAMSPEEVREAAAAMAPEPRANRTFTDSRPESPVEPELTGSYSGSQPAPERVEASGPMQGPSGVAYRDGNTLQPHGGQKVVPKQRRPVDPETGEEYGIEQPVLSSLTPEESAQRRMAMKKGASDGSPVTLDDQGNTQKVAGSNRVSSDSKQYKDVIPDNRVGAAIESVFSGNPERVDEFRGWYSSLDDATRQRVDERMLADPVGAEALRVMQGQEIDPARRAAIDAVRQLEGGGEGTARLAPADPQYVVPDDLRKKAKNPEGVRDRFNYDETMDPTRTLPEPGDDGRIRGASGVGSLRKQLQRSKVQDGEYVKASKINDRQAELDNMSEHQSFASLLQRTLDEMAGGKQGTKKNAPEQMDTDRGGGAGKKGSRIAPEASVSGSMQDLWRRMQSGDPRSRSLSPAEAFETPEQFAEAALSLAEFNPSRVLNDADAYRALVDAARREFYTPGNVRPATSAPAVGNNANPSAKMEIDKQEKGGPKSSSKSTPEPKTEGTTRNTDEPVYMDVDAMNADRAKRAGELERVLAESGQWGNMGFDDPNSRPVPPPQDILTFDPEAYPEAAKVLMREGYHLPPTAVEGVTPSWSKNRPLKTSGGGTTTLFAVDPNAKPRMTDEEINNIHLRKDTPETPSSPETDDPGWVADVLGDKLSKILGREWTPEGKRKARRRLVVAGAGAGGYSMLPDSDSMDFSPSAETAVTESSEERAAKRRALLEKIRGQAVGE